MKALNIDVVIEIIVITVLLAALAIFSAYGLRSRSGEEIIVSQLYDNGISKGWELSPDLEAAIKSGDVSLEGITVIKKGGDVKFEGGDSDKISIIGYETIIEKNEPKLYSDEYWNKICREGENTYVLRTLGLATEKEGAE